MNNFYFPSWWDVHNGRLSRCDIQDKSIQVFASGKGLYGDWGRLGGISVDKTLNVVTQYSTINPLVYEGDEFCSLENKGNFNIDSSHSHIANRKRTLKTLNYMQKTLDASSKPLKRLHEKDMKTFVESHANEEPPNELKKKSKFVTPFIQYLLEQQSECLSSSNAYQATLLTNSNYSGGCIKIFELSAVQFVLFCDGTNLSQLTICRIDPSDYTLHETSICRYNIKTEEINQPIFQLDCSKEYNDDNYIYILVRCSSSLSIFKLSKSDIDDKLQLILINYFPSMQEYTSCKIGIRNPSHFYGSFPDQVNLYNCESSEIIWSKQITNYASVIDNWNEIQPIKNSFLCVTANRTSCFMHDIRESPLDEGTELFNITSSQSNNRAEWLFHASSVVENLQFYLFSTFNAIFIDVRSPKIPVCQWTVPLNNPVSFSSFEPNLALAAGCQFGARHTVWKQNNKPFSKSAGLRSLVNFKSRDRSIMSLGLATLSGGVSSDQFVVFSLDNHANILCQKYSSLDRNSKCPTEFVRHEYRNKFSDSKRYKINEDESSCQNNEKCVNKFEDEEKDCEMITRLMNMVKQKNM